MINDTQLKSFHGRYLSNHDFQVDSVIHHTIYKKINDTKALNEPLCTYIDTMGLE